MKQMYREFGDTPEKYTNRDIIEVVSKVADKDFEPFFQTYISGRERLPLSEYFDYAGLDVQIEYSEELPTSRYVLRVLQASLEKQTWRLIAVNGAEVEAFADLRERSKTWRSGDVLEITIEVDGETLTLPVTLSGVSDDPPTARDASVRITKEPQTTKLQRAILAGILGKK
jgi:predicted metalloprotease with PDZ domain